MATWASFVQGHSQILILQCGYCGISTVVLFTPLPVSGNHVSAQLRNVMFLFILSLFFVLLNLWICLTEALDLLRGFLAHQFGSMLKCQPRDAARIGKYEFGAAKL